MTNVKYSDDYLIAQGQAFLTRWKWQRLEPRTYFAAAARPEVFAKATAHMPERAQRMLERTDAEIAASAAPYMSRSAWSRADYGAYQSALRRPALFASATAHMPKFVRDCKWTEDALAASAAAYTSKGDWKMGDYRAYQAAGRRPEIFKRVTSHMKPKVSIYSGIYVIYIYEFPDRRAYVGLTMRLKARKYEHQLRGAVKTYSDEIGVEPPEPRVVESLVASPEDAVRLEGVWASQMQLEGWVLLNEAPTGSLGAVARKWLKMAVLESAKPYAVVARWIEENRCAYNSAVKNGWLDEVTAHMKGKMRTTRRDNEMFKRVPMEKLLDRRRAIKRMSEWNRNGMAEKAAILRKDLEAQLEEWRRVHGSAEDILK